VRKNQASLTAGEKRRFVAALLELKRSGRYDAFVSTHNDFIVSDTDHGPRTGHRSPSFLPWHRRFLLEFERALQSVDASVALPYWDWTTDSSGRSSLWAPDFLGGSGRSRDGRVTDGPFAASTGNWPIAVRVDERTYLRRALGAGGLRLPTRADVESVLSIPTYDMPPWNSGSDGFRNHLEGWRGVNLHNRCTSGSAGTWPPGPPPTTRCSGCTTPTSTSCGPSGSAGTPGPATSRPPAPRTSSTWTRRCGPGTTRPRPRCWTTPRTTPSTPDQALRAVRHSGWPQPPSFRAMGSP